MWESGIIELTHNKCQKLFKDIDRQPNKLSKTFCYLKNLLDLVELWMFLYTKWLFIVRNRVISTHSQQLWCTKLPHSLLITPVIAVSVPCHDIIHYYISLLAIAEPLLHVITKIFPSFMVGFDIVYWLKLYYSFSNPEKEKGWN